MYKQFIIKALKNAIKYKLFKTTTFKTAKIINKANTLASKIFKTKIVKDIILNN